MIVAKLNMKYYWRTTEMVQYISEATQSIYVVEHQEMNEKSDLVARQASICTPLVHMNINAFYHRFQTYHIMIANKLAIWKTYWMQHAIKTVLLTHRGMENMPNFKNKFFQCIFIIKFIYVFIKYLFRFLHEYFSNSALVQKMVWCHRAIITGTMLTLFSSSLDELTLIDRD